MSRTVEHRRVYIARPALTRITPVRDISQRRDGPPFDNLNTQPLPPVDAACDVFPAIHEAGMMWSETPHNAIRNGISIADDGCAPVDGQDETPSVKPRGTDGHSAGTTPRRLPR